MRNWKDKILTAGDIAYAKNFDPAKVFADIQNGNLENLKVQFEQYAYASVGDLIDIETTHTLGDEKKLTVDNCGIGDIEITMNKTAKLKFTWLDVNNVDLLANILGLKATSSAGTTVPSFAQTLKGGEYALDTFIALGNQNGDGSLITPTTVTIAGTPVVAWPTTFAVSMDSLGRSGITFSDDYVGAITGDLVITYAYSPYPYTLTGYESGRDTIPLGAYRFRSCLQKTTEWGVEYKVRLTTYFIKFYLTSEVVEKYINRSRKDFEWASIEFTSADGGYYLKVKEMWTA